MATEETTKMAEQSIDEHAFLSRLYSLFEASVHHHFTEVELTSLTKQNERELLISLSKIFNLIRQWTNELQCSSKRINNSSCIYSPCVEDEYLTKIVAILGLLMNAESQYVRHTVGNICLAISEFLLANGGSWDRFIHLLCVWFEFAMCNILGHSPQPLINETEKSLVAKMIPISNSSTWNGIAEITRVLRGVVKFLKGKDDAELVAVFLKSSGTCLKKVPWDLLKNIHNGSIAEAGGTSGEPQAKILFLGNLVQLMCSVIGLIGLAEGDASQNDSAILLEACELVPKLLNCVLSEDQSHILPYFRHKILMLMIKLSFHMQLGCSILILWLQLLQKYYQDLLLRPISQFECSQDDSLEGSPFLSVLDDKDICHPSSCHVQRKAVFLLLRCSLSLISFSKTTESFLETDLNTVQDYFVRKKGLLEFYGWLQGHVPSIMFSESKVNLDKCITFASSFIRFYMQEDDLLFEVLLLLLTIPSWNERPFSKQGKACHVTEEDILFHLSNLFNPLLLFHVFLAELQYDHQVLLDYLISNDIGGKCAEYLLKCLRIVCDAWKLFVEYSGSETDVCQRKYKRRRLSDSDFSEEQKYISLQSDFAYSTEQHKGEYKLRKMCFGSKCLQLESAKKCLVSLKSALRKLHRRKLFPYNPEVLIRRLTRFEDLCDQLS